MMLRVRAPDVVIASRLVARSRRGTTVLVRTPLELIRVLDDHASISTAVLGDAFEDRAMTAFLRETYPRLRLVTVHRGAEEVEN